jgi:hypothetical protein
MRSFKKMPRLNEVTDDQLLLANTGEASEFGFPLRGGTTPFAGNIRMLEERPAIDAELERRFSDLAREWERDTGHLSTMTDILLHPSHFAIVGLGQRALPLILRELGKRDGHWFTALAAIAGESVATDQMTYDQAIDTWLAWGRAKGHLDVRG